MFHRTSPYTASEIYDTLINLSTGNREFVINKLTDDIKLYTRLVDDINNADRDGFVNTIHDNHCDVRNITDLCYTINAYDNTTIIHKDNSWDDYEKYVGTVEAYKIVSMDGIPNELKDSRKKDINEEVQLIGTLINSDNTNDKVRSLYFMLCKATDAVKSRLFSILGIEPCLYGNELDILWNMKAMQVEFIKEPIMEWKEEYYRLNQKSTEPCPIEHSKPINESQKGVARGGGRKKGLWVIECEQYSQADIEELIKNKIWPHVRQHIHMQYIFSDVKESKIDTVKDYLTMSFIYVVAEQRKIAKPWGELGTKTSFPKSMAFIPSTKSKNATKCDKRYLDKYINAVKKFCLMMEAKNQNNFEYRQKSMIYENDYSKYNGSLSRSTYNRKEEVQLYIRSLAPNYRKIFATNFAQMENTYTKTCDLFDDSFNTK